jgi:hypothetical protein
MKKGEEGRRQARTVRHGDRELTDGGGKHRVTEVDDPRNGAPVWRRHHVVVIGIVVDDRASEAWERREHLLLKPINDLVSDSAKLSKYLGGKLSSRWVLN